MSDVKKCRNCDAPVRWATTERGKNILVDFEPVPEGDLALTHLDPASHEMHVRNIRRNETVEVAIPRYTCHFATCPNMGGRGG